MKLSIITVNLNNHNGLRRTIESVSMQQFSDFEYIIIDGNSQDRSLEIIKDFEINELVSNFKWISEKDSGVFQAMNKGIRMSCGEYLLFLNSGDFLLDSMALSDVFSKDYGTDILCAQCNVSKNGNVQYVSGHIEVHTFRYYYKYSMNHQSTFIKRELFTKFGMYREDLKFCSDREFFLRTVILNNCSTENIQRVICDYNLEGMSSDVANEQAIHDEEKTIFANPLFQKFVPDYELWFREQEEMIPLYWIKSQSYLYQPLFIYYRLICFLVNLKKSIFEPRG